MSRRGPFCRTIRVGRRRRACDALWATGSGILKGVSLHTTLLRPNVPVSISFEDHSYDAGPFDILGDIHGCIDELREMLALLGDDPGRKLVFVGDLVDRGPSTPEVVKLVSSLVEAGRAYCVCGNHDLRLARALRGMGLPAAKGLTETLGQMSQETEEFRHEAASFLETQPGHLLLDHGRLLIAHAGLPERFHRSPSAEAREIAIHGQKTGERDQFDHVRYPWAKDYRGTPLVVFGHTPVEQPVWENNTLNLDTGCVFGGKLTAYRYPEREFVTVTPRAQYSKAPRPFLPNDPRMAQMVAR